MAKKQYKAEVLKLKSLLDRKRGNKEPVNMFLDKDVVLRFKLMCQLKGWTVSRTVEDLMLEASKKEISDDVFEALKESTKKS